METTSQVCADGAISLSIQGPPAPRILFLVGEGGAEGGLMAAYESGQAGRGQTTAAS